MGVRTLKEFVQSCDALTSRSEYVSFPGFDFLYVRFGPRYFDEIKEVRVLDIANVTALNPGAGAFRALLTYIQDELNVDVRSLWSALLLHALPKAWKGWSLHVPPLITPDYRLIG